MRYSASERAEIIRLVEPSHLPAKRTLDKLGIPRATFYRWCDRYGEGGVERWPASFSTRPGLKSRPGRCARPDHRPCAGASGAIAARAGCALHRRDEVLCLGSFGLPAAEGTRPHHRPAYVVIKAANEFKDKTTAINQLWQTDFTYLKITGWGWYFLSTVLDDFSRYIVAWRLGPALCASDVTATLDQALAASGLDHTTVTQRPRLLSDNGSSYVAGDLGKWLEAKGMQHVRGAHKIHRPRERSSDGTRPEEPHSARQLLPAWRSRTAN